MDIVWFLLLVLSAVLFTGQFVANKYYQRYNGSGFFAATRLSVLITLVNVIFFLVKNLVTVGSLSFSFSWFTFTVSTVLALLSFVFSILSLKTMEVGDLSIYSVFMMIGNIVCSVAVGLLFESGIEQFSPLKAAALCIMLIAIVFSVKSGSGKKLTLKAFMLYMAAFFSNGVSGVAFVIHKNFPSLTAGAVFDPISNDWVIDNSAFILWNNLMKCIVTVLTLLAAVVIYNARHKEKKVRFFSINGSSDIGNEVLDRRRSASYGLIVFIAICLPILYGLFNGIGNLLMAEAMLPENLGEMIVFPVVNGGTILLSCIAGLIFFGEKINTSKIIGCILIMVSTVMFMFT